MRYITRNVTTEHRRKKDIANAEGVRTGTAPDWDVPAEHRHHTVMVEIDEEAITERLAKRAAYSRGGRATALGGLIVAKRLKGR